MSIVDSVQGREHSTPSAITRRISKAAIGNHPLLSDAALWSDLMAFSLGTDLSDLVSLNSWVCHHVCSQPHQNQAVEGQFNVWDDVKVMAGPRLKKGAMDAKMRKLANVVFSDRKAEMSPKTGRPMKFHWTKEEVAAITDKCVSTSSLYTPEIWGRVAESSQRAEPDYVAAVEKAASRSQPERRAQYDENVEARQLEIPKKGGCHK